MARRVITVLVAGLTGLAGALLSGVLVQRLIPDSAPRVTANCGNAVSLYFTDDAAMSAAADRLRADDRVAEVRTETREQAGRRADAWAPTAVPPREAAAAIHVAAVDPANPNSLVAGLRSELTAVGRQADCTSSTDERRGPWQLLEFGEKLRCGQRLTVSFSEDQEMVSAATRLERDQRVRKVVRLTEQQLYQKLRAIYADDPNMVGKLSPANLLATLDVTTADGVDPNQLAGDLARTLPNVEQSVRKECVAVPHPVVPPPR